MKKMLPSILVAGLLGTAGLQAGGAPMVGDTYISTASPATAFGAAPLLNVGGGATALMQFDLAPLGPLSVPSSVSGQIVKKATLVVFVSKVPAAGAMTASEITSAWTEATTTQSTSPVISPSFASVPVTAPNQFVSYDVTALANKWALDPSTNFGIALAASSGTFVLDSKETPGTSHVAVLEVELAQLSDVVLRKDLTLSAPGFTSLLSIHLTGTHTAGGRIFYTVRATDGGSQIATEEGVIQYLATANSITCTVQTTDKLHLGTVNSGCTPGFFNPGSQPGVSIFDNVTFSSPAPIVVHEVDYRIVSHTGPDNGLLRLEP